MSIDVNDPEVKDAIKAAVAEATDGLVRKRDELLAELKTARKGQAIDPAELDKRDEQIEELRSKLTAAERATKQATTDADKARKALESAEGFTSKLLVDNGLSDALAKAGVTNPVHMKAAKAMLAGQVQITADGDSKVAKVGDKALSDFVSEWSKGDEGKFFVAAPVNSGGGSTGGGRAGGSTTMQRAAFEAMSAEARRDFSIKGGQLVD